MKSFDVSHLGRVVEVSLSFVSILLFSSSLVTLRVLVPCWLARSELSVEKSLHAFLHDKRLERGSDAHIQKNTTKV